MWPLVLHFTVAFLKNLNANNKIQVLVIRSISISISVYSYLPHIALKDTVTDL